MLFRSSIMRNAAGGALKAFGMFTIFPGEAEGVYEIIVADTKNKLNLLGHEYFTALSEVCHYLSCDLNTTARVAILTHPEGHSFSGGLNLAELQGSMTSGLTKSPSRKPAMPAMALQELHRMIRFFQDGVSALARCRVPILCAIDRHCIGGATSVATACDMRFTTATTRFTVKEVQVGLAADIGVLQRLPAIVGEGRARELAFTARVFDGMEAKAIGFVEDVFPDYGSMMKGVRQTASTIASNSPLAVQGTKRVMNWQLERRAQESLEYQAAWNAFNLPCDDTVSAAKAFAAKQPPTFTNYVIHSESTAPLPNNLGKSTLSDHTTTAGIAMQGTFTYQINPAATSSFNTNLNNTSGNSENGSLKMAPYVPPKGYSNPPSPLLPQQQSQQPQPMPHPGTYFYAPTPASAQPVDISTMAAAAATISNPYLNINMGSKLFVGQVPGVCTEEQLRPIFAEFGPLLEVKIMREQSGRSKGSAWVRYESAESARRAIEALNEKWVIPPQTNPLRVQFAAPPRRGPGPQGDASQAAIVSQQHQPPSQQAMMARLSAFPTTAQQVYAPSAPAPGFYSDIYTISGQPAATAAHQQSPHPAQYVSPQGQHQGSHTALHQQQGQQQSQQQQYLYANVNPTGAASTTTASYTYVMPTQATGRQGY